MNEVFNVSYNTTSLVSSNMKNGVIEKISLTTCNLKLQYSCAPEVRSC